MQGQTIKASRIILRQKGVGLSMLRNVKNKFMKKTYLRNYQGFNSLFVTLLNINSVSEVSNCCEQKIPSNAARAYDIVEQLWKTGKVPVETLWNQ
jgi:hypothetical protein